MTAADYFARVQASPGWLRVLASFARFAAPQPGWRALDVGCGPGALVRVLAEHGCRAVGMDVDAASLTRARALAPSLAFLRAEAAALPFPDGAFDLVTATNVLFLLPDPAAGLRALAGVCRPSGRVAVLNPSPQLSRATAEMHADTVGLTGFERESFVNWGRIAERERRFSPADLQTLFQGAGLQPPQIAAKIGPGLALFAQAEPAPNHQAKRST